MIKLTKNRKWVGLLLGLVAVIALVFAMSFQQLHANPADSVEQATDQTKTTETVGTEADSQVNNKNNAEISDADTDADSSTNNTNGDEAALATADINNDESSSNDSYIVKFAMPKDYINSSNKLSYIQLIQDNSNKATRMNDTEKDITIDGTVYRIYSATTAIEPTKEKTFFKVSLDIPTNDAVTTQWYSDVEWQYGDNIVAVPQDYTRMKLPDYNGFIEFVNTSSHTVTYDVQEHGIAPQPQTVKTGDLVPKPADPTEIGYTFGGWYKEEGCTNAWNFETDTMPDNDLTLYAKWSAAPATVNVTFDPNYEGAEPTTKEQVVGNTYQLPETPTREHYEFVGWFTDPQGGTQVTSETIVEATTDHTLYAHWTEIPAPTYNITIVQPERGGSVEADKATATKGETVTLTVTPEEKFSVKDVSIKDAAGTTLEYQTITENIQYSFTMPESDATAKITLIAEKPEEGYVITEGANGTYVPGSGTPYTIRVNGDISRFANEVTLNGNPIDPANYDVRSGSTIVTLHSDYLDTLPAGTHQIGIKFVDETVNANLTINGSSDAENTAASSTSSTSSSTGDSIPFAGIIALVAVSAGAVVFASRKRTQL